MNYYLEIIELSQGDAQDDFKLAIQNEEHS